MLLNKPILRMPIFYDSKIFENFNFRTIELEKSIKIILLAFIFFSSLVAAQADAPPRKYTDLGPHFILSPGIGASTTYRDLLLHNAASARIGVLATYRGFSISGSTDNSFSSTSVYASEISASYSYKLPYFDIHVGIAESRIAGELDVKCDSARVVASTNFLASTKADVTIDKNPSKNCDSFLIGIAQEIFKRGPHQIDLNLSGTKWENDHTKADGWSIRAIGRWQFNSSKSIYYHVGYISSETEKNKFSNDSNGILAGVNMVWQFR